MKPKKNKRDEKTIYSILNRLNDFKQGTRAADHTKTCPIYSPPQNCVKSECVWYNVAQQDCWIQNPRPLKDRPARG